MGVNKMNSSQSHQLSMSGPGTVVGGDSFMHEIEEMLKLLNNNSDEQIQNYRQIEDRYGKQKPKLSAMSIRLLLLGNQTYRGLVKIAGQHASDDSSIKNNHIQCSAGLQLLSKLLDFEFNRDAENYIQVFTKETPSIILAELQLETHIIDQPANNCRQHAFTLLKKYADKHADKPLDKLLMDSFRISPRSLEEYKKWIFQRSKGTANQFINRQIVKQDFPQYGDPRSSSIQNADMLTQMRNVIVQNWKKVRRTKDGLKIQTATSGSRLFKITSHFDCDKSNLVDFFYQNLYTWDTRCLQFKQLDENDVVNAEDLPIYFENYDCRNKQVLFLYKFELIQSEDGKSIYVFKKAVDKDIIKRHVFQASEKLATWKVYLKFSDYSNPKYPSVRSKVMEIFEHDSDHFFLSEMTGDTNDMSNNLAKLQAHVHNKYSAQKSSIFSNSKQ